MFNLYKLAYDTVGGSVPSVATTVSHGEIVANKEVPTHLARENALQEHMMSMESLEEETKLQSYIK